MASWRERRPPAAAHRRSPLGSGAPVSAEASRTRRVPSWNSSARGGTPLDSRWAAGVPEPRRFGLQPGAVGVSSASSAASPVVARTQRLSNDSWSSPGGATALCGRLGELRGLTAAPAVAGAVSGALMTAASEDDDAR
jgi:hypothetical protein